jgi:sugar lactone lactonase YvrE
VDGADNLYMSNNSATPIVVFGPTDTGTVVPVRALGGQLTMLTGRSFGVYSMAIDTAGNLYVSCSCQGAGAILEFGPTANGDVAPTRVISGDLTLAYGGGIAVDSAGNIYQSTTTNYSTQSVIKYSPTASGNVAPDSILTVGPWTGYDQSIAVY